VTRREGLGRELFAGLLIALASWLAWQAVRPALAAKLPPVVGVRFDPASPEALARAGEAELAAGRDSQAAVFARNSLAGAPFNVPALRVLGLAKAASDVVRADRLLTLAGEWSMRDIPTESWLMQRRLDQGDIAGVIIHADRLGRVREELHPALFPLFDAVAADPRGAMIVADRLSREPMWRPSYIGLLAHADKGEVIGPRLALALQRTAAPMSDQELSVVYGRLYSLADFNGLRQLQADLKRPPASLLTDGDFPQSPSGPAPLTFSYQSQSGLEAVAAPAPGKSEGDTALRLSFDGFTPGIAASQLILAAPGAYRLSGQSRWETQAIAQPPVWAIICSGSSQRIGQAAPSGPPGAWTAFQADFVVPAERCPAQVLILQTAAGDHRTDAVVWFDDLRIAAR
jgi:hypothetical protein